MKQHRKHRNPKKDCAVRSCLHDYLFLLMLLIIPKSCPASFARVSFFGAAPEKAYKYTTTSPPSRPILDLRPELSIKSLTTEPQKHKSKESRLTIIEEIRQSFRRFWFQSTRDLFFLDKAISKDYHRQDHKLKQNISHQDNIFGRVKNCFIDLWFGISHVFKKYVWIWIVSCLGTELVHTPFKMIFRIASNNNPSFYRMFRQRLVTLLTFCDKISLITEDLLIRLGIPLLFYHPFCNLYHEQQQSKNKRLSYLACQSFSSLVSTVLVGPIIEEALYRSLFHRTWLTMSKLLIQNNREQKPQEKTTFVKESWVLTNSLLFGIAHISNWMPLDKKYLEDEISIFFRMVARRDVHKHPMRFDKEKNILSSLYQSQHAFILSLICFTPLYQQRGVMASISAHSTMNLLNLCFPNHRYLLAFASALHLLSNL